MKKLFKIILISTTLLQGSCSHNVWDPAHKKDGIKQKELRNNNNRCQFSTHN